MAEYFNMYGRGEKAGLSNEALAARIQSGDTEYIPQLLSRNEGFLTKLAVSISNRSGMNSIEEDLKQEGALALIRAARRYNASKRAAFLTYARAAVRSAMLDYAAGYISPVGIPPTQFHQLRKMFHLCADQLQNSTNEELIERISRTMKVSEKTARGLMSKAGVLFGSVLLGDRVFDLSGGGDPARIFRNRMARYHLYKLMKKNLTARERNLIYRYCGFGNPGGKGMTFEAIAVRMNFNSPSGAQKAYERAIEKLRECLENKPDPWAEAERAVRAAERKCQEPMGFIPPPVSWCLEEWELVERFPVMVRALIAVFTILHETLEKDGIL